MPSFAFNHLKRPASPSSESSASKRAVSEDPPFSSSSSAGGRSSPCEGSSGDRDTISGDLPLAGKLRLHGQTTPTSSSGPGSVPLSRKMTTDAHIPAPSGAPPTPPPDTEMDVERPGPMQQIAAVKGLADAPLKTGEQWYLVSRTWYKRWQAACTGGTEGVEDKEDARLANITLDDVGPIDNRDLLASPGTLKPNLRLGVDLEAVPAEAWKLLERWYGAIDDDQALVRSVIAPGGPGSETIEFYPPQFTFKLITPGGQGLPEGLPRQPIKVNVSLVHDVGYLKRTARSTLNLDDDVEVRLWRLSAEPSSSPFPFIFAESLPAGSELITSPDDADLVEAMLNEPSVLLGAEVPAPGGRFIPDPSPVGTASSTTSEPPAGSEAASSGTPFGNQGWLDKMETQNRTNMLDPKYKSGRANGVPIVPSDPTASGSSLQQKKSDGGILNRLRSQAGFGTRSATKVRGLTGLTNLGNTCFMNSALQCMSNCPELNQYFLSGVYRNELNPTNPLGMGGKVALAFGELIERLWDPRSSGAVAPREFKAILGRFASQFLGYGQQDSQELLAFLLDALHEDLNRVKQKPFDEIPDWNGGGDEELMKLAERCWELYKRRNDSVIVDLFQGQYKSTLVCPDCGKVAIKFDPVLYLTLALPSTKKWRGKFFWVPLDTSKPRQTVVFEVAPNASIRDIKRHVAKILGVDPDKMAVVEDFSGKPWKVWNDLDTADQIRDNDVISIYETPDTFAALLSGTFTGPSYILLPVLHFASDKTTHTRYGTRSSGETIGPSFVIALTLEEASTVDGIYDAVAKQYARYLKQGEDLRENTDAEGAPGTPPREPSPMDTSPQKTEDTADASESSAPPPLPPRRTVARTAFKIRVPQRSLHTFPTSNSVSSSSMTTLEDRLAAASAPPKASTSTLPGSFAAEDTDDLYGEGTSANTTAVPTPDLASTDPDAPARPLLKTGDWIECHWTESAQAHFFQPKHDAWVEGPLIEDPEMLERTKTSSGKKKALSIEDCLRDLRTPELLGEDDMWRCPDCKDFRQATKTMQIWKAPDILVVHLKRFSSARTAYGRSSKIETFVDFPIEGLDLSAEVEGVKVAKHLQQTRREQSVERTAAEPVIVADDGATSVDEEADESLIYDLFGVSNHFGGLGGGHYTAFAKNEEDGKWHNYDDSHVSLVTDPEKVKTSAAYLLFYRRRTSRVLGAKTHGIVSSAIQSRAASAAPSEHGDHPMSNGEPSGSGLSKSVSLGEPGGADSSDSDGAGLQDSFTRARGRSPSPTFGQRGFGPADFLPAPRFEFGGANTLNEGYELGSFDSWAALKRTKSGSSAGSSMSSGKVATPASSVGGVMDASDGDVLSTHRIRGDVGLEGDGPIQESLPPYSADPTPVLGQISVDHPMDVPSSPEEDKAVEVHLGMAGAQDDGQDDVHEVKLD